MPMEITASTLRIESFLAVTIGIVVLFVGKLEPGAGAKRPDGLQHHRAVTVGLLQ